MSVCTQEDNMGEPKLLHPIGAKTTWLMEAVQNASLIGWVVGGGGGGGGGC